MAAYVQQNQPPGVPPLELTGERTLPDVPAENYWYRRHLAVYEWIAARVSGAAALDMAVHAWDIAVATGQPSPLPAALAAQLMPVATAIVEPLRTYGVYAAALAPEPGDDAAAALLRYLGRHPGWTR